MSCLKGRFVHRHPDEVRYLFAFLLKEVCHDVEVEPPLETLTGEALHTSANSSDEARLDVNARGFWMRGQRAFFDVTVFNPFAKSHLNQKLNTAFTASENEKKPLSRGQSNTGVIIINNIFVIINDFAV